MSVPSRVDVALARRSYEAGQTLREVADLVGISPSQLSKVLRRSGCAMRSRPRQRGRARSAEIQRLRDEAGLTWAQIGAAVGVSAAAAGQDYLLHRGDSLERHPALARGPVAGQAPGGTG